MLVVRDEIRGLKVDEKLFSVVENATSLEVRSMAHGIWSDIFNTFYVPVVLRLRDQVMVTFREW